MQDEWLLCLHDDRPRRVPDIAQGRADRVGGHVAVRIAVAATGVAARQVQVRRDYPPGFQERLEGWEIGADAMQELALGIDDGDVAQARQLASELVEELQVPPPAGPTGCQVRGPVRWWPRPNWRPLRPPGPSGAAVHG